MEVTVHEAKTQLSRLIKTGRDGETVTILRRGVPVARLTPVPPASAAAWAGIVPDSALRPMTDEESEAFVYGQ